MILVGPAVFKLSVYQYNPNFVLINNSRTAWLLKFQLFVNSVVNLLKDAYIIFQKSVENFEIKHKPC